MHGWVRLVGLFVLYIDLAFDRIEISRVFILLHLLTRCEELFRIAVIPSNGIYGESYPASPGKGARGSKLRPVQPGPSTPLY